MATNDTKNAAQILAKTSLAAGMNDEDLEELLASAEVALRAPSSVGAVSCTGV